METKRSKWGVKVSSVVSLTVLLALSLLILIRLISDAGWMKRFPGDHQVGAVVMDQQHFYIPINSVGVFALSRKTPEVVWQFPASNHDLSSRGSVSPIGDNLALALDENVLYLGNNGSVFALNAENGGLLWKCDLDASFDAEAGILVAPGVFVVASSTSGSVYAVERASGTVRWVFTPVLPEKHTAMLRSASVDQITLVTGVMSFYDGSYEIREGQLYVLSADSGELLWNLDQADWAEATITSLPLVVDIQDKIYLVSYNLVSAFVGNTGEILWQTHALGAFNSSTVLGNDLVAIGHPAISFVDLNSGTLHCKELVSEIKMGGGKIIAQNEQTLYYVKHRLEISEIPSRELQKWPDRTDFVVVDRGSCTPHLYTTINGHLLTYDPTTGEGLAVTDRSEESVTLTKISILPR
jgi:hypothetical protein